MNKVRAKQIEVGVVLPAYNEERVIGEVLDGLPSSFKIAGKQYKLQPIVVNDGSTDTTAKVVSDRDNVILINHIINSGAGAATRTGLHYARDIGCQIAVTMDSDGQHSPRDLERLIKSLIVSQNDFIIGSRLLSKNGNMPIHKKLGNVGLSLITYALLGVYASDTQSGLKALNRRALERIDFHSNSYAFCSEMIWRAHQAKLSINEVPIEAIYTEYSMSRGQKNFTGALNITKQLIKRRFLNLLNG